MCVKRGMGSSRIAFLYASLCKKWQLLLISSAPLVHKLNSSWSVGIRKPLGEPFSYERWNLPTHQELEHLQDENICILKRDLLISFFTHISCSPKKGRNYRKGWFRLQTETTSMISENQNTFREVFKKENKKHPPKKHKKNSIAWWRQLKRITNTKHLSIA